MRLLILYFFFALYSNISHSKIIGPRNWLAKLGKEELDEIRSKCTPSDQDSVVQRVLNGSPANLGDFPYVALFTADTQKRRTCTASFITYRHVLTARHCIMPKREPMLLMAGGICRSDAHKCKEAGLLKVNFDFAIFQNLITREFLDKKDSTITDPESVSDILIIQLSQSVSPGWLKENQIGIVCLPLHKQVPPPEKFAVVGWGKNSLNTDANPSLVLRYAVIVRGECLNSSINLCGYPAGMNDDVTQYGIAGGDSGGPAVAYSAETKRHTQYGINYSGGPKSPYGYVSIALLTTAFLDDLCFYLGLCSSDNVTGLTPTLSLGAMYFPQMLRGETRKLDPFRPISEQQRAGIVVECKYMRGLDVKLWCDESVNWAANLINHDNEILCGATFVTSRHLITIPDCIIPALKAMQRKAGQKCPIISIEVLYPWPSGFPLIPPIFGSDVCVKVNADYIHFSNSTDICPVCRPRTILQIGSAVSQTEH